ncbi:MAG: hypothetical protein U0793_17900 [Gemmataceae bacterium]
MLDYLLIVVGFSASIYLAALSGLQALPPSLEGGLFFLAFAHVLPPLMFLPLGVLLLWPIFFLIGKIAGRSQGLSLGEWLWGLAWLVSLFVTAWILWKASGPAPEGLFGEDFKKAFFVGYTIYLLAMGAVAFFVWIYCLFTSTLRPWTHTFGLTLLFWPVIPLGVALLLKWQIVFS